MLTQMADLLEDAVLAGARAVLETRAAGALDARYKDATELVTAADTRSDAAMLAVLQPRLAGIDRTISLRLEESGAIGDPSRRRVGADPLDGTNHFAAGGNLYAVQAHYIEDDAPLAAVVFQPEVFLPLSESASCVGRLVRATRGGGAFVSRTTWRDGAFDRTPWRRVERRPSSGRPTLAACVPITTKMTAAERALAERVYDSGLMGASIGTGNAGGNVMMIVFGGEDVYANLGAGEELDLAPPQVIAEEVGLTVWSRDRRPPRWTVRKQPFIVAPDSDTAERVLRAAGL